MKAIENLSKNPQLIRLKNPLPLTIQKLSKNILKLCIWELNLKQEKGSIIPVPDPRPKISPKMKEQDLTPNQDTILITDMILAPEQELIGSNLLA